MAKIKIKLVRSIIGRPEKHRRTIEALGLRKIGQVVEKEDTPQIRGMIAQVDYMVEVTE
ncbi:50S ribosomal protein L30 [Tepidimicrobium xylanilyticum]|uniref:Large ribosomal subunit protein uL30 n=1 Tax=Tepidimicrobium xylanilyticum TaxID=1123352 RepID=A0A1H2VL29_9FIRM|nr:50S ribosomal protein L30 [Tepidimicrobium xylanilyticum]GMG97867.1 50S ribosomal protein L30 [Tepidimicrobium xylanilyticum]SDW69023.1 LSU ribosomal protein L30P [Tepidimicrobium xylanilyticum]